MRGRGQQGKQELLSAGKCGLGNTCPKVELRVSPGLLERSNHSQSQDMVANKGFRAWQKKVVPPLGVTTGAPKMFTLNSHR